MDRAVGRDEAASKDTHICLRLTFAQLGAAHFTMLLTDAKAKFVPVFHKTTYKDAHWWGVRHFLSLSLDTEAGEPLLRIE